MANKRRFLKYGIFLIAWVLSICLLLVLSANNELNTFYYRAASHDFDFKLPKNHLGAIRYTRRDPKENCRPVYSVSFKNLLAENNKLGLFKTALHKVVKIRDLELRFYKYTSPTVTTATKLSQDKSSRSTIPPSNKASTAATADIVPTTDITAQVGKLIRKVMRKFITPNYRWWVNNLDLGNVSEVRINNFDCKAFCDGDSFFSVQCKRAIASYKHPELVLRGHVIIKTADGSTLESNHVRWDTKKQHFTVKGVYVLNRKGVETMGRDICVDAQLNNIKTENAKAERKEGQGCFAKL